MANIDGIGGFNPSTGSSILFAAYGNDIVNVSTGLGYQSNITAGNKGEFVSFLDNFWYQNGTDGLRRFNGTTWKNQTVLKEAPVSKYISVSPRNRLLFGYVTYASQTFASRVWFTDLPKNNDVTYGLEYGSDLSQTVDSKIVTSITALFKIKNIKVGDPFLITSGANAGEYTIASIENDRQVTLTENMVATVTGSSYWTGSNWFDVTTNESDVITGFGENSDRDLIFKLMSIYRYDGNSLRKVKDAVGTSSQRSVINHRSYTYYFHGSDPKRTGIYRFDGTSSILISRAIDPFIKAMSTATYDDVVAWKEGNEIRFFIGNLSASNYLPQAINNVVITYNADTGAWGVDPIQDVITCATTFRTNNEEDTYTGTSDDQVFHMDSGNSYDGTGISAILETKVYYPSGSELINTFPYIQVIGRNARGIKVKFKLWDNPKNVDDKWWSLGQIEGDKTEFPMPQNHQTGSGIQFRFDEMTALEKDAFIEKISIFYKPDRSRLL